MERLHFSNFDIAGFTYWDGALVFENFKIGTKLRFERDLDNKYDPKAVAIYYEEHKIGYVPRSSNIEISKFCEQGYSNIFDVRISRLSPKEQPESQIGITVHILQAPLITTE